MNVLILGSGYVGTNLDKYLNGKPIRNGRGIINVRVIPQSEVDYTKPRILDDLLSDTCVDFVINCSGYTGKPNVDACEKNKPSCWHMNVTVPSMLAQACYNYDIPFGQVSSGCIYTGYDKDYTEDDEPNFGLYNSESSFYSKSKHASEIDLINHSAYVWRIRMPFCNTWAQKNIITKIYKYNNLISMANSLTSIDDLCIYIGKIIERYYTPKRIPVGIYNVVNEGGLTARRIVELMRERGINNPDWKFIEYEQLDIVANRSNCVLSQEKNKSYGIQLPNSVTSLSKALDNMSKITI
tara:strand:- start:389 stop:1276 length:888 start_codon:yes stop_codon:yes gene_type:complete